MPAESTESLQSQVLGVDVNPLTMDELNDIVRRAVTARERVVVASQNLHSVYLFHTDVIMRRFYTRADYRRVDGMPLIFLGRMKGLRFRRQHRVTWLDWLPVLLNLASEEGWRIFYLGGKPGVAERAASKLRDRFPRLRLEVHDGFFDLNDSRGVVEHVNGFRTDVLLVGMGMPRQERWILETESGLDAPVILPCGAIFDYVAGVERTPPRWLGPLGLEWLFRFSANPTRLWRRYLEEPLKLALLYLRNGRRWLPPEETSPRTPSK